MKARPPLLLLSALALLCAASAAAALYAARPPPPPPAPGRLFPALEQHVNDVGKIVLVFGRGLQAAQTITLRRAGPGGFAVAERGGFPARADRVKAMLLGLAGLEAEEPRTALPKWHGALGLVAPEELGRAVRITLYDRADGRERAALLVGKRPPAAGAVLGRGAIYVRRAGENQSWLARGALPLRPQIADWLALDGFDLAPEEIAEVELAAPGQKLLRLRRAPNGDFLPPPGAQNAGPDQAARNAIALAPAGLRFEDALPAARFDFSQAPRAVYRRADGGRVIFHLFARPGAVWAAVEVEARPGQQNADPRFAGPKSWAFKLPLDAGRLMLGRSATQSEAR